MANTRGQHLIGMILGSCVLERLIGYGGSSAVFLAQQHTPPRKVAVKVFLPRATMDMQTKREFYRRFLREAEVASQLDHPNILPIYSYGEQDGLPYIIMPYVAGGTLSEYIAKNGPLSLQEALWHLEQIAAALDYTHGRGCVHCDIKPANILLDGERRIMLADFGIARVSEQSTLKLSGERGFVTQTNALMGTPDYISPEQALGQTLDGRSDVYSLGVLMFFLLAGQLPFKADSGIRLALAHVHDAPPSLCLWRADVSPLLDAVIHKALAKSVADRYASASEFCTAFAEAIKVPFDGRSAKSQRQDVEGVKAFLLEPVQVAQKPVIQVKQAAALAPSTPAPQRVRYARAVSARTSWFGSSRWLVVAAVLLLVLAGTLTTTAVVMTQRLASHAAKGNPPVAVVSNRVGGSNSDLFSDQSSWEVNTTSTNSFFYDNQQSYHIVNKAGNNAAVVLYPAHEYQNFQLTMTAKLIRAGDSEENYYGVILRSASDQTSFYVFGISTIPAGAYEFSRYDSSTGWSTIAGGDVPQLAIGTGQSNTIVIKAHNNSFTFFVNNHQIGDAVSDSAKAPLLSGDIGLYVEDQDEVAFSHLYIDTSK